MVTAGHFHVGRFDHGRNPNPPAAPASANPNPFPPSRSPGLFDCGQSDTHGHTHCEVYGVLGGGPPTDQFRLPALARLQLLPRTAASSAATRERMPASPNGNASSSCGIWGIGVRGRIIRLGGWAAGDVACSALFPL
jgi:hypothetical protein